MLSLIDRLLAIAFRLHDWVCDILVRHLALVKKVLLLVAHLSLFGFFLPDFRREFGSLAGNLLIVILFLSPASKIFRMRLLQLLMGLRRELGILFGYLATVHGVGYLTDPLMTPLLYEQLQSSSLGFFDRPLFFGFLGYILTLPLLFTSNTLANRILGGKNWKLLHRTVYIMALVVVFHRFFIRGYQVVDFVQMLILVVGYILAKLLAWKSFLPPLVQLNTWVASRYQAYRSGLMVPQATPPMPNTPPLP